MKENGTALAGRNLGRGIVSDEKLQRVRIIILFHLLLPFPRRVRLVIENEVLVVVGRGGILDPQVSRCDLAIEQLGMFPNLRMNPPRAADSEDACGCPPVPLVLDLRAGGQGVNSQSPNQPVTSQSSLPRADGGDPFAIAFLEGGQRDGRAVPILRGAHDALRGFCRKFEGSGAQRGREQDGKETDHALQDASIGPLRKAPLIENQERRPCPVGIDRMSIRWAGRIHMREKEIALGVESHRIKPWSAPNLEIGEVHVRREILTPRVFIDGHALQPLLHEVGPQGPARPAMVKLADFGPVIECQHPARFPGWQPSIEPSVVGVRDFYDLADRKRKTEDG